jgi:hypothetical protein
VPAPEDAAAGKARLTLSFTGVPGEFVKGEKEAGRKVAHDLLVLVRGRGGGCGGCRMMSRKDGQTIATV